MRLLRPWYGNLVLELTRRYKSTINTCKEEVKRKMPVFLNFFLVHMYFLAQKCLFFLTFISTTTTKRHTDDAHTNVHKPIHRVKYLYT